MSRRQVKLVLLCEDAQHEAFARRFLSREGWVPQQLRVEKAPSAINAAQWVRQQYPREVHALRARPHVARGLIVMVDADAKSYVDRLSELDEALPAAGRDRRQPDDHVAIVVPKRNIETWIAYLNGEAVDEDREYPKLARQRECVPAVRQLKTMCDRGQLRDPAPPSLQQACGEYRSRIPRVSA